MPMERVKDVMTPRPASLDADAVLTEAAERMRDDEIGDVVVVDQGTVCGIVTDRDIVVRAVADHRSPEQTTLREICTSDLVAVSPDESVNRAIELMRDHAIRRLVVVEDDAPVGILSLGDLAVDRDPESVLADISAAPGDVPPRVSS